MLYFYVIDTETTGLKAGFHEVIQISAIRYNDRFQKTLNIKEGETTGDKKFSLEVVRCLGACGIDRKEAVEELHAFLQEDGKTPDHRCIVAHNAPFDRRMLHSMWQAENKTFPAHLWLCTKEFSRKYAKKLGIIKPKLSLAASIEMAGLTARGGAHNAVIDTLNTTDLFEKLLSENLGHVQLIKRVPHETGFNDE